MNNCKVSRSRKRKEIVGERQERRRHNELVDNLFDMSRSFLNNTEINKDGTEEGIQSLIVDFHELKMFLKLGCNSRLAPQPPAHQLHHSSDSISNIQFVSTKTSHTSTFKPNGKQFQ